MSTSFVSNDNKGLIWQLLTEAGAFANYSRHIFYKS